MKILIISKQDYTNLGYVLSQALQKIGIEAIATRQRKEYFGYPRQGKKLRNPIYLKSYAEEADVIIFMHGQYRDTGIDLGKKKVLVWHTGSGYRQKSRKLNALFNPIVDVSLCMSEFLGLGAKNERCLNGLVDTDFLQPVYKRKSKKVIIAHYPSSSKGVEVIEEAIRYLDKDLFIFRYDPKTVDWDIHLKRMSECDIYISSVMEKQISRKGQEWVFGMYGIAALEAAALGKLSVCRLTFQDDCTDFPLGLHIANNSKELAHKLEYFLSLPGKELLKLKKQSRDWVVNCHSGEVVARRLLKIIEEIP